MRTAMMGGAAAADELMKTGWRIANIGRGMQAAIWGVVPFPGKVAKP